MRVSANVHLDAGDGFKVRGADSDISGHVQWLQIGDTLSVFVKDERLAELREVIDKHLAEVGYGIATVAA